MTTFPTHTDRLDLTRQALRHSAAAWELALSAAMDHDLHDARHVMRGALARRSMLRDAHQHLQWDESTRDFEMAWGASAIDVVADLIRINRLLGQLSQTVLATPDAGVPDERERACIDVARRIGTRRLHYFAESVPRPMIDREYIVSGHELVDALADLADSAPRHGTAPDVCLTLMMVLVETSRHATLIRDGGA